MAATTKTTCMVLIAAVMVVAAGRLGEAAMSCGTVVSYLNPCLPYVTDQGPLGNCCNGIKGLFAAAKTTADRQSVCSCLKSLAASYSASINAEKAAGLVSQCGVNIPYKISGSIDCSKIQ